MVRKVRVYGFWGPQGGQKGGHGGQKIKYGSKCLKLPNSSRKVVISILKISLPLQNTWMVHLSLKIFKIEITTFLEELGNFKHFEPYFIF